MIIKYNERYERWCSSDGKIYRQDKKGKFIECKQRMHYKTGYLILTIGNKRVSSHRLIWETLKGEIPPKMVIDHINTIKTDNRLENLRCVTHKENNNNPLTLKHRSEAIKGLTHSEFGAKFKEHFGITCTDNRNLYYRELQWYHTHNHKCRWEK